MLWGIVMIGFGFTKTYHQIMALRIVLGILEAGFFPGECRPISLFLSLFLSAC